MRLIIHEFLKVFLNKRVLFMFISFILLNGVLLFIQENGQHVEQKPAAYREMYKDIEELSSEEAVAKLEREETELQVIMDIGFSVSSEDEWQEPIKERFGIDDLAPYLEMEQQGDYLRYTDSLWREIELYREVLNEVSHVTRYDEYLEEMDEDAQRLASVSLFSNPDTFSHRNIQKTPRDFDHLRGTELVHGPTKGILMATEFGLTDIFAVLLLMVVVMELMTREKEQQSLAVIKTTYKGRGTLVMTKMAVAVISSLIIVLSFYAVNYYLASSIYGFGPLDRPIQSVRAYLNSPFDMTILQYLVLFLVVKFLVYAFIALLLFMISVLTHHSMSVYLISALVIGVSAILNLWIPSASYFSFFKYINLLYFLNTDRLFGNYLNLNIFGYPFQYRYVFIGALLIGFTLFILMSYQVFCRSKQTEVKAFTRPKFLQRINLPSFGQHIGIFRHEAYKMLIVNKVFLILIVGVAFQYYTYQPMEERLFSVEEYYYKSYLLDLEGEVTEETYTFLDAEEQRYNDLENEMMELSMQEDVSEFLLAQKAQELRPRQAFNRVLDQVGYLERIQEEKDIDGWLLYDPGYQILTGQQGNNRDLQNALVMIVLMIASLTPLFTFEMQTRMIQINSPTRHGRKKAFNLKLLLGFLITTFIYLLVYIPEFYNVLSAYGTHALRAPVVSMQHFSDLPFSITIIQYLILISLVRYLGALLAGLIVYYLSVKLRNFISVALTGTAILAIPIILAIMNIPMLDYLLLTPFLAGNVLFNRSDLSFLQNYQGIWLIAGFVVFFVSIYLFFMLLRKNYRRYSTR